MDPERWKQVDNLLQQALELPAEGREAFLQRACGDDSALRDEVWSLLISQQQAGSFLESPAIEVAAGNMMKAGNLEDSTIAADRPGTMIAHYRVAEKIGEGGMGEVYRALDTKLQRDVALKILPQAMAHDAERMARFEREAQVLASLNHPNIAAIHGLEESNGIRALVMELVEGETLAERISVAEVSPLPTRSGEFTSPRGGVKPPLQMNDALPIARQIAEALEYAHERGVIHRDLKPANVKITPEGTVKVLDFGLAKVLESQDSSATMDMANSPTLSTMATQPGMLLGTAAYMSPEQAKGQRVDRRADIWAFGCVLYEMLAGRKAFEGETISDVLAAVIKSEPDWTALPEATPTSIQKLIRRCLQKDQKQRLRDIGDARIAIEETISGTDSVAAGGIYPGGAGNRRPSIREESGAHRAPLQRALPWALAGLVSVALIAVVLLWKFSAPARQPVIRFTVSPPENTTLFGDAGMSLSPDGRKLAFISSPSPGQPAKLWVRPLDSLTATPFQATEGANFPFWSPDSNDLGFYANGKLEKVAISGGQPQTLCEANGDGATWSKSGVIVFANQGGLFRVSESGSTPTLVAAPDRARQEFGYRLPRFLPDGRHFLFSIFGPSPALGVRFSIAIGSLDSKEVERLSAASSNAFYAPPGYLLYMDQTTLMARPFDADGLKFTGQAAPIAEGVGLDSFGYGYFTVSQTGVLGYQTAATGGLSQMVWLNRKGEKLGTVGKPDVYSNPALSADGTKLAVGRGESGKRDIWVYDLKRGAASRLTFNSADDLNPVWSGDGSRILFTSSRQGQRDLYEKPANGLGKTELTFGSKQQSNSLDDLSPDGRYAIYDTRGPGSQLWVLPQFGEEKPSAFIRGGFTAREAQFSPNGQYVAYTSNETGGDEVYVQTFPQHTGKWQISTGGGVEPMWRGDGNELFYLSPDDQVMAVGVNTAAGQFQAGTPKLLFQAQMIPPSIWRNIYVVSPDGQRFLLLEPAGETKPSPITVILNWPALLKKQ